MEERSSATPPLFQSSAEEILKRLIGDQGEVAGTLRTDAEQLIVIFQGWAKKRPADPDRIDTLNRLFALYRRTMDYIERRK